MNNTEFIAELIVALHRKAHEHSDLAYLCDEKCGRQEDQRDYLQGAVKHRMIKDLLYSLSKCIHTAQSEASTQPEEFNPDELISILTIHGGTVMVERKELTKTFNEMIREKIDPRKKK